MSQQPLAPAVHYWASFVYHECITLWALQSAPSSVEQHHASAGRVIVCLGSCLAAWSQLLLEFGLAVDLVDLMLCPDATKFA